MKQYTQHLRDILENGTFKPAARENMPGTKSLFGYQWKHNLADGFPLLTTKQVYWKGVVVELLWFLRGDTNVKFLNDNGVTFWNQDAYAFYLKQITNFNTHVSKENQLIPDSFDKFVELIQKGEGTGIFGFGGDNIGNYQIGDCGYQYGKVWRDWDKIVDDGMEYGVTRIDQIKSLLHQLKNSPEGRRHILTSIDPTHDEDLALYWCHALTQFNCRPVNREAYWVKQHPGPRGAMMITDEFLDGYNVPKYYLDCQVYQRSADMFLGVPLNIASYALLTHIFCKLLNMVPGEMTYSYGDSHIYDNHMEAVTEQLSREERPLPTLNINTEFWLTESGEAGVGPLSVDGFLEGLKQDSFIQCFIIDDLELSNYNPHPPIKAELSTGIVKQEKKELLPISDKYICIQNFEYTTQSPQAGPLLVRVTRHTEFNRIVDEPHNFTDTFTIIPEEYIRQAVDYFKPL